MIAIAFFQRTLATKTAQERRQEQKNHSKVEDLEEQLAESKKRTDKVSKERSDLMDNLVTLQKILNDMEVLLEDKNEKIR